MKPIPEGFELADEPRHWAFRYPGVAIALVTAVFPITAVAFGVWIDDRQQPQWDKVNAAIGEIKQESRELRHENRQENRQLATFQLETSRYSSIVWSLIAESANVKLPMKPKVLDRAEDRVRDIQEGAN